MFGRTVSVDKDEVASTFIFLVVRTQTQGEVY